MLVLWGSLRAIALIVECCGVQGARRRQRTKAQLHLVAIVVRDCMLAIVVIAIATRVLNITVLCVQVVRQRTAELVAIFGSHTTTAWHENAPYAGRQDFVPVAQIPMGLGPTTGQTFLGMPADVRTHSGIYI